MLWFYGLYKYVDSYSAGINFSRQNLATKVDPRLNQGYLPTKCVFKRWKIQTEIDGTSSVYLLIRRILPYSADFFYVLYFTDAFLIQSILPIFEKYFNFFANFVMNGIGAIWGLHNGRNV